MKKHPIPALSDEEILEYLNKRKTRNIFKRKSLHIGINNRLGEMKARALNLMDPKSVHMIFNPVDLPLRECFAETEKIALAVVTIGSPLPDEVTKLMDQHEYVDGVILDAIGSAGVEAIADIVNKLIIEEAADLNLQYSKRYSPGYCNWNVKDQEIIFSALPADKIGVRLTDAYLMSPLKSVSFAINFSKDIKNSKWENRCKSCVDRAHCSYRMN